VTAGLAALLAFVAGLALRPMAESDLFFHLAAGREILRRHGLPRTNLFSFTYPDYPDLDTSWLAEVGAAAAYGWRGFPAVVVAKTAVLLIAFGWACRLAVRRGAAVVAALFVVAAAAYVGRDRLVERPLVFSFVGEVATLAAIDGLRARRGLAAWRAAAAYLGGVVLWANLHAGVFVAPLLLGAAALAAVCARERQAAARLAAVGAASVGAMLLTPVGLGLFRYLLLHLQLPALHPIDEFRRPTWSSDAPLWTYAALAAGVFAATGMLADRDGRRRLLVDLAPLVPLALLAARTVRFGADFALVSAPALAVALTTLARRSRCSPSTRLATGAAAVALLALTVVPRRGRAFSIDLDTGELPLDAIAFADASGLRERMYNDFEIGSYLILDPVGGYPRHRVFVDPRLPAYPPEMHRLLGRDDLSRADWDRAMDRYGVTSALLAYAGINRRVAWWDPARWALVWNTGDARVFVRRLPRFAPLIAAREVPATFSFTAEEGSVTLPLERQPPASPVARCEWDRRLGDVMVQLDGALSARARAAYVRALGAGPGCLATADEATLTAWLGGAELQAGRPALALAWLDRAIAAGDRTVETAANRAAALDALDRTADALAAWRDVAARAGHTPLGARARDRLGRAAAAP
jgi:hypothetical protein